MGISLLPDFGASKPVIPQNGYTAQAGAPPPSKPFSTQGLEGVESQAVEPAMGDKAKLTPTEVVEIVQKANKALMNGDSNLKFVMDKDSGENVVQVVDRETQEVLRQIPSVEMLKIAKAIEKMQGVLVSTQA